MERTTGRIKNDLMELDELKKKKAGDSVRLSGIIHDVRDMGEFAFVILRKRDGIVQVLISNEQHKEWQPKKADSVIVSGTVEDDDRAPDGFEIYASQLEILSRAKDTLPIDVAKWKLKSSLDTLVALRPVTLRNLRQRAIFKIQEGLARGFREYLTSQAFSEIHTPKIVAAVAEGGANIFKLEYFHQKAFLAQSPQFYKQEMIPVFERVFEIGPVFRAEKHSTARHLNEYTSMDFEMAFIDSFYDIMEMETGMLQYSMDLLKREYSSQLETLHVDLPDVSAIPILRFDEAKKMASEKYGTPIRNPYDMEPDEEQNICRMVKEDMGSDFVFVTHYPSKKRPFYAMDDPENPKYTLSFDLLFRGMEVTTGGQRIHDYDEQIEKMKRKNLDPADFESYLMAHKYGMPPHGGLGLGLERLTMKLLNLDNVRYACLFPRDIKRLEP